MPLTRTFAPPARRARRRGRHRRRSAATRLSGQASPLAWRALAHAAHRWGPSAASRPTRSIPPPFLRSLEFLATCPPTERAAITIARRRGPTARCCANTNSWPSIAKSRSRPAIFFPAGPSTARCPGPTLRATEGDRVRVTFINQGSHPHTIHFHGWHPPEMDGSLPEHQVHAGRHVRLRVRRRALRPAPLSLPCGAVEAPHAQGPLRRLHRRSARRRGRRPTSS